MGCITHQHIKTGLVPVSDGSGTMPLSKASSKIVESDFFSNLFTFKKENKHCPLLVKLDVGQFNDRTYLCIFPLLQMSPHISKVQKKIYPVNYPR